MNTKMLEMDNRIAQIAFRIREARDIMGYTQQEMAEKTDLSLETYVLYESGGADLPFTFIHK